MLLVQLKRHRLRIEPLRGPIVDIKAILISFEEVLQQTMIIEFTIDPSDYECLVNNPAKGSTLDNVLSTAARSDSDGNETSWRVVGGVLDIVKILRWHMSIASDPVE